MNFSAVQQQINPLLKKGRALYDGLSQREQKLLFGAIAFILVFSMLAIVKPISSFFSEQSEKLIKVEQEIQSITAELVRYQRLITRRNDVEQEFKSVEMKDGALSHLENLIRDKAGISQGSFTIKDQPPKPFGTNYQQTIFSVIFSTTDYPRLIDFLKEIVDGPQRLLLKRLDIKRSRSGGKLDVELELSSISK